MVVQRVSLIRWVLFTKSDFTTEDTESTEKNLFSFFALHAFLDEPFNSAGSVFSVVELFSIEKTM